MFLRRRTRDFHTVPLPLLTKRELRDLVVEMRLRQSEERRVLLEFLSGEQATQFLMRTSARS